MKKKMIETKYFIYNNKTESGKFKTEIPITKENYKEIIQESLEIGIALDNEMLMRILLVT